MATITEIIGILWAKYYAFLKIYIVHGRNVLDYLHIVFDKTFYVFLYIAVAITSIYLILTVIASLSGKRIKEKKFDMEKAPFVTVQIPTMNELVALRCAKKCLEFEYPKDKYEILIGDDSDKKEVSKKIAKFASGNDIIKVIKRDKNTGFKPGNLNSMLKHSKGDILVLFDSDFTPEKDFLKRIVAPFVNDREISAVQARWNFNNFSQNLVTIMASTIVYVFHHVTLAFMSRFGTASLCGSAEAVKKKDLIELGRWRSGSLTEDIEYSLRLHKSNKKIVYLPELECYSDVPHKTKDLCKQQMRWAYGVIDSYRLHIKDVIFSRLIPAKRKTLSLCAGFGYMLPVLILMLCAFGTLSFVTHKPAPIDLAKFLSELGRNILLTSGLVAASFFSLYKAKKIRHSLKMVASSFSIGLVTTYYVNKGIFKSILGKPMSWYLLDKNNNYNKSQQEL